MSTLTEIMDFISRAWNKISMWLVAITMQAMTIYPGLNGEAIVKAWNDGAAFWIGVLNIALAILTTRAAIKISIRKKDRG